MAISAPVLNVSVALNTNIDDAARRATALLGLVNDPARGVNPASIAKAEDVAALLADADASLAEFARMNGFSLS